MSIPTCVLTHKGAALQAKTPAGAQIPVTRWQMGTGILPAGEKLEDMTQLIQPLMYLPISSVTNSDRQALVLGQFVNKDMDAFDWEELGLWAQDPEEGEILYAVGNARGDGEHIEAGTDKLREFIFGMELVFSGTANVTAEVSRTLVFATLKDLYTAITAHNEDPEAHPEIIEAAKAAADDVKQGLNDLKREVEDVAALASSSGGSGDVGELEDTALEVGSFVNAGAGWNTYRFREPFDAPPQVVLQAQDFAGTVQVKNITAEGFLYCLRTESAATTEDEVVVDYIAIEYGGDR